MTGTDTDAPRHDWTLDEVLALFDLPFADLMYRAQTVHRRNFDPNRIQASTLLSIKTGGCSEDCAYCSQSVHYKTGVEIERLMSADVVAAAARRAREGGSGRFCMGAAWRSLSDSNVGRIADMIRAVKAEGMETCVTLGMVTVDQARRLKEAGLDFYNHNIDTSEDFYSEIITTRCFQDRLDTLQNVQDAGIKVCCGGIVGLGEARRDRAAMLTTLATMPTHPESVPINMLVAIPGTPLEGTPVLDPIEFVRTIAIARILMPAAFVRLSAGREAMSDEMQALCFLAGANSAFLGDKLLTTPNPEFEQDHKLFDKLGIGFIAPAPSPAAGQEAAE